MKTLKLTIVLCSFISFFSCSSDDVVPPVVWPVNPNPEVINPAKPIIKKVTTWYSEKLVGTSTSGNPIYSVDSGLIIEEVTLVKDDVITEVTLNDKPIALTAVGNKTSIAYYKGIVYRLKVKSKLGGWSDDYVSNW